VNMGRLVIVDKDDHAQAVSAKYRDHSSRQYPIRLGLSRSETLKKTMDGDAKAKGGLSHPTPSTPVMPAPHRHAGEGRHPRLFRRVPAPTNPPPPSPSPAPPPPTPQMLHFPPSFLAHLNQGFWCRPIRQG
jgi:hypothetical protein